MRTLALPDVSARPSARFSACVTLPTCCQPVAAALPVQNRRKSKAIRGWRLCPDSYFLLHAKYNINANASLTLTLQPHSLALIQLSK